MKVISKYATVICNHFQINKPALKSKNRKLDEARKWFYYLCRTNGIKEEEIAKYIGRDRTTINIVFSRFNKRVDRFKALKDKKEIILNETKIN